MTEALPAGYCLRAPTPDDVSAVAALIDATDIEAFGESNFSAEELASDWDDLDLGRDAWLVLAPDGVVTGYGAVWAEAPVQIETDAYVHPAHTGRGIGTFLVRATEARAREHAEAAAPDERVVVHNTVYASNAAAVALLRGEGYAPVRYFWHMVGDLVEPPPAPAWPSDVRVRAGVRGEDEQLFYTVREEAWRDHWGYQPITFDEWKPSRDYDASLWFVAFDGDQAAGIAMCKDQLGMGFVHTLAVRRPWRRRGLGTALLHHAFGEFYRRGLRRVTLDVDAASPTGATRLYERAGLRVATEYATFEKELRAGGSEVGSQ